MGICEPQEARNRCICWSWLVMVQSQTWIHRRAGSALNHWVISSVPSIHSLTTLQNPAVLPSSHSIVGCIESQLLSTFPPSRSAMALVTIPYPFRRPAASSPAAVTPLDCLPRVGVHIFPRAGAGTELETGTWSCLTCSTERLVCPERLSFSCSEG